MARQSLAPYRSPGLEIWRGADPFLSLHRQINRMFDDAFRDAGGAGEQMTGVLAPRIDIVEQENDTRITAELPGVREEDVDLSIDGDLVTLRAEKRVEHEEGQGRRHMSEKSYGMFERTLRLAYPVDADAVQAHFDRGVLTVILPRNAQAERNHKIQIQSGPPVAGTTKKPAEAHH